jgi:hypothetical protein
LDGLNPRADTLTHLDWMVDELDKEHDRRIKHDDVNIVVFEPAAETRCLHLNIVVPDEPEYADTGREHDEEENRRFLRDADEQVIQLLACRSQWRQRCPVRAPAFHSRTVPPYAKGPRVPRAWVQNTAVGA